MKKRNVLIIVLLLIAVFVVLSFLVRFVLNGQDSDAHNAPIALIRLEGEIKDPFKVIYAIQKIRKRHQTKGVLVRVNSPGGTVGSAQEILSALSSLKKDSIHVAVSFGDIAASGGVYSTLAADKIFANPGSLTGSIGVILQFPRTDALLEKIGVEMNTVKSGDRKDAGSPFRAPTSAELAYFQRVTDDTHMQFLEAVRTWRGLSSAQLDSVKDGRVLTGRQALSFGLVDALGGYQDALAWLSEKCELDSVPEELFEVEESEDFFAKLLGQSVKMFNLRQNHSRLLMQLP